MKKSFYSNGKLLLTGEYVVLDGALALALPTKKGQSLTIETIEASKLIWKSIDADGTVWFEDEFLIDEITKGASNPRNNISKMLLHILKIAKQLNPKFLNGASGYKIETVLEFSRDWGLGSSSTLINNIAHWAEVDAYQLLELTFGGSGYDIACAEHDSPITYQLKNEQRIISPIVFHPKFSDHLYFVYLNKKQNSRDGISHYQLQKGNTRDAVSKISAITKLICNCDALITFKGLINRHEVVLSKLLNRPTLKEALFSDFNGSIKSLGAWGGDFVLVASKSNPKAYFKAKGYETVISYKDMLLN